MINVLAVAVSIIYNSIVCCKSFHELNPIVLFSSTYNTIYLTNSYRELEPTIVLWTKSHCKVHVEPTTVFSEPNHNTWARTHNRIVRTKLYLEQEPSSVWSEPKFLWTRTYNSIIWNKSYHELENHLKQIRCVNKNLREYHLNKIIPYTRTYTVCSYRTILWTPRGNSC